jgi:chemotaxis protein CheD
MLPFRPESGYPTPTPTPIPTPVPGTNSSDVYVHPGRTAAVAGAEKYTTIVGSGGCVCIWDPYSNVGGMSHFLLPERGNAPPAARFGDVALKALLDEITRLGADPRRLRASVYGGSAPPVETTGSHLGDRNVEAALTFLKALSLPIIHRDVGGRGARKVVFDLKGGKAEVQRIGTA